MIERSGPVFTDTCGLDPAHGIHIRWFVAQVMVIRFKVSPSGNWVKNMNLDPLVDRCGGGGPPLHQSTPRAAVTNGRFTAHITYRNDSGKSVAKATVTGKFDKHRQEHGKVSVTIFSDPSCDGVAKYVTTARHSR
jgi:hypothetical protein